MILVTVGTDGPFDRLIAAVDQWAGDVGREDVVAQVGNSAIKPRFMRTHQFLEPVQFRDYFIEAEFIIAHAGMGTILSALRYEKALLVMPRRASLGEQRNEHQLATARRLMEAGKVAVAFDEIELRSRLMDLAGLRPRNKIGPYADPSLIDGIRAFIDGPDQR